ncbi:MAG: hypothetical protein SFY96_05385 [Planctomycetota bacterium]|nr:hypothetical protein [Planctomycetota bacterium]
MTRGSKGARRIGGLARVAVGVAVALAGVVLLCVPGSIAQQRDEQVERYNALIASRAAALNTLDGQNAAAYLALAEDVAEEARDANSVQLARALYVHAVDLDRQRGGGGAIAASALLGLADLSKGRQEASWLRSIALTLRPQGSSPAWVELEQIAAREDTATKAATVLGMIRAGDGIGARTQLRDPAVRALLDRYARLLSDSGAASGVAGLEREASRWPCRECQNQRVVKRGVNEYRVCPMCQGDPGEALGDEDMAAQLRLESWLLSGIQRSWGAQLVSDLGTPLREPDIAMVAASQGVDASKRRWKENQWSP